MNLIYYFVRPTFIAWAWAATGGTDVKFIAGTGDPVKLDITPPDTNGLLDVLFLVARWLRFILVDSSIFYYEFACTFDDDF